MFLAIWCLLIFLARILILTEQIAFKEKLFSFGILFFIIARFIEILHATLPD